MANLNTDIYAGQIGNVGGRPEGQRVTGDVLFLQALYTTTGAEAAADVINIGLLPIGAIIIPHLSRVSCEALGGTGTAISKIGDAADDDRYSATSIAVTSAASTAVTPVAGGETSLYKVISETNVLKATVALSSGSVTAGKKLLFLIAYRMP